VKDEVKGNEARMCHKGENLLYLHYADINSFFVLKDKRESAVMRCNLKPEVVYEVENVRDIKQHNIVEMRNEVEMKT
jgi:hypothetical protein